MPYNSSLIEDLLDGGGLQYQTKVSYLQALDGKQIQSAIMKYVTLLCLPALTDTPSLYVELRQHMTPSVGVAQ